jgi:hypothetical protein
LRKPLDAGPFQPEIGSFRLHLAAEGKAAKTVRIYTEAVQWFAAAQLVPEAFRTRWEEVDRQDVQRWMVWLLGRYSDAYVSNQYRALQQFGMYRFEWPDDESVEFHLGHGDMIRLLRGCGLEVEDLVELRPEAGAATRYPFVTLDWARQWPCEEVWKARKSS